MSKPLITFAEALVLTPTIFVFVLWFLGQLYLTPNWLYNGVRDCNGYHPLQEEFYTQSTEAC